MATESCLHVKCKGIPKPPLPRTDLQVPVDDSINMAVMNTLQDLLNTMAGLRERGRKRERERRREQDNKRERERVREREKENEIMTMRKRKKESEKGKKRKRQ